MVVEPAPATPGAIITANNMNHKHKGRPTATCGLKNHFRAVQATTIEDVAVKLMSLFIATDDNTDRFDRNPVTVRNVLRARLCACSFTRRQQQSACPIHAMRPPTPKETCNASCCEAQQA